MPSRDEKLNTVAQSRRWIAATVRACGGGIDTPDIVQDVMVAACRAIDGFRGDASLRAWLWRIAHNQTLKRHHESLSRRRREAVGQWWGNDAGACPQARLEARETLWSLRMAFATMPRELQEAFMDRLEGRTYATMSRRRAVSVGTAHRRAAMARERLISAFADAS